MSIDDLHSGNRSGQETRIRYSIVITCYNQEEFIKDAIESALAQDCESKEIIVVDDGSTDNSLSIVKRFGSEVMWLALPANCGVGVARNRGAELARGEYLLFLDGDDLLTDWALDVYEELIDEYHPAAVMSEAKWFQGAVPTIGPDDVPRRIEFVEYETLIARDRGSGMYTGAFVIDRSAFNRAGGWSPEFWHLDGQDLYTRLAYSGKAILVLSPYTMLYRMHALNSIRSVKSYVHAAKLVLDRERAGLYPALPHRGFERYARHGGVILFCIKRLLDAGYYKDVFFLALRALPMILAAMIRRALIELRGRRPVQGRELKIRQTDSHRTLAQIEK